MPSRERIDRDESNPQGFLGRYPIIGLLLGLLGLIIFSILAVNVQTNGPLTVWDKLISNELHARAVKDPPLSVALMRFGGDIGQTIAGTLITMLALFWLFKRYWYQLAMLIFGVSGGTIWFLILSDFFGRPRPFFPDPLESLSVPGFPSGHSITMVLLYGLIVYLLLPHLSSWRWRLLAVVDYVLLVLFVGYARVYIGSHYPTDVLAGYSFGLAWGALVFTAVELYRKRRTVQSPKTIDMAASPGRDL
jgi:undecaprenyl-diphosphatase